MLGSCARRPIVSAVRHTIEQLESRTLLSTAFAWAQVADAQHLATDSANNIYALGETLTKYDPDGQLLWQKEIAGVDLAVDSEDAIYVLGYTVTKLDNAGTVLWEHAIAEGGVVTPTAMAVDSEGDLLVTGSFDETVDFDPGAGEHLITSRGWYHGRLEEVPTAFLSKFDPAGCLSWVQTFDVAWMTPKDVMVDVNDAVYLVDSHFAVPAGGGSVQKFDEAGTLQWDRSLEQLVVPDPQGAGWTVFNGLSVVPDHAGWIWVGGSFLDPSSSNNITYSKSFVARWNAAGDLITSTVLSSDPAPESVQVSSLALDDAGRVYLAGSFRGEVSFGTGRGAISLSSSGSDIFLATLSSTGSVLNVRALGGSGDDGARDLVFDSAGNMILGGSFQETADVNPNLAAYYLTTPSGSTAGFLAKYQPVTPAQQLERMLSDLDLLKSTSLLSAGQTNSLRASLQAAQRQLLAGRANTAARQIRNVNDRLERIIASLSPATDGFAQKLSALSSLLGMNRDLLADLTQ